MESTINKDRWVPSSLNQHIVNEEGKCEIFFSDEIVGGRFYAIAYMGKGGKPAWNYSFKTKERMMEYIENYITERKVMEMSKKVRQEEKKKRNSEVTVKVGDLFHYSWGYDQTQAEFYQVVEVKGKTATLRRISAKSVPNTQAYMCEHVSPMKDHFVDTNYGGETIKKRIQAYYDGSPCFSMPYGSLTPTTEESKHYSSWYA